MLNILEINDFSAPELDIYARRTEAQLINKDNPEAGLFIAESPKVIGRALDAGYIPVSALVEKHQMGYKTAALALTDDSVGIDNPELMQEEKLAIILGTEGEGLMDRTIEMCDYTVKIPMSHDVDSLNVAAASAVAFWQLGKKQK